MIYSSTVVLKVLALTLAFLSLARQTHAYLDPGTGSYFVQILIAGLAGGAYLIVSFWGKIKQFISSVLKKGKSAKGGSSPEANAPREHASGGKGDEKSP